MGRTSGYWSQHEASTSWASLTIQGVFVSAAPDGSSLLGLNEWMQNRECVTPSWTHRVKSSGVGNGPPKPPMSEPVDCIRERQAFNWIA